MPLRCYLWMGCGKVIKSCKDFLPGTVRATGVLHGTHTHSSNIVVPEGAAPPYSTLTGGRHLRRKQCSVLCGMPLLGDFRELRSHVIFAWYDHPPGTNWTSGPIQGAGLDRNTPFMSRFASPPNFALGAEGHIPGLQDSIFRGGPLLGQFRKLTGKIVDAESHSTVGAHRAAKAICAGMDGCTPYMAMAAPLPYLFLTSRQHTLRCQR